WQFEVVVSAAAAAPYFECFREWPVLAKQFVQALVAAVLWVDVKDDETRDIAGCDADIGGRSLAPVSGNLVGVRCRNLIAAFQVRGLVARLQRQHCPALTGVLLRSEAEVIVFQLERCHFRLRRPQSSRSSCSPAEDSHSSCAVFETWLWMNS